MIDEERQLIFKLALLQELAAHLPGSAIDADLTMLGRSFSLFITNAAELSVQLEKEERPETFLKLGPGSEAEFNRHLDEIDRLLHNFLAAQYTLATYTLKVRNKYADESFTAAYDEHSPFDEPVSRIIKALRNDAQHAHLPVVRQQIDFTTEPELTVTCRLVVQSEYLLSLKLNGPTKAYVKNLDGDPALRDLVDTYALDVERFVGWFIEALIERHSESLAEIHGNRKEADEIRARLRALD